MLKNKELEKEVAELKNQNNVLQMTLMSAGIVVDEKFGDNEDGPVRIPTKEELESYTEIPSKVKGKATGKSMGNTIEWDNPKSR